MKPISKILLFSLITALFLLPGCFDGYFNSSSDNDTGKNNASEETYLLDISIYPENAGTVSPQTGPYDSGHEILLETDSSPGFTFKKWGGVNGDEVIDNTITMNGNKNIIAIFDPVKNQNPEDIYYNLNLSCQPENGGTIEPASTTYLNGETIHLTPEPSEGYEFKGWGGLNASQVTDNTITVNSEKWLVAIFEEIHEPVTRYTLAVSANPLNGGSVLINPEEESYSENSAVTLTPEPSTGYIFKEWSGSNGSEISDTTLTMDGNKTVTAVFDPLYFDLTINIEPSIGGSVTPGSNAYSYGTEVPLVPNAEDGYVFDGWSGIDSDDIDNNKIIIDQNKTITAHFSKTVSDYSLNITVSPQGTGTVILSPPGSTYSENTLVTLEPSPVTGYIFKEWSGDASSDISENAISMDGNKNIIAVFEPQKFELTIDISPAEGGSAAPESGLYEYGTEIELSVTTNEGYRFDSWEGEHSSDIQNNKIVITDNKNITAAFIKSYWENELYSENGDYIVNEVIGTSDGNFLAAGHYKSNDATGTDILYMKINPQGEKVWGRLWSQAHDDNDSGYSVKETFNSEGTSNGYILAGFTKSEGYSDRDIILVKIDTDGNELWNNYADYGNNDTASSIVSVDNGNSGYVIAGKTDSFEANGDLLYARFDASGNLAADGVPGSKYGGPYIDDGTSIIRSYTGTTHDGYIISGNTTSVQGTNIYFDYVLMKIDLLGNILWTKIPNLISQDTYNLHVIQTSDGGYIMAGMCKFSDVDYDVYILKTDSSGTMEWYRCLGGALNELSLRIDEVHDNGFIVAGQSNSFSDNGDMDLYLIRLDSNGDMLWQKTFGGETNEVITGLVTLNDGLDGYMLTGSKDINGQKGIYIVWADDEE